MQRSSLQYTLAGSAACVATRNLLNVTGLPGGRWPGSPLRGI